MRAVTTSAHSQREAILSCAFAVGFGHVSACSVARASFARRARQTSRTDHGAASLGIESVTAIERGLRDENPTWDWPVGRRAQVACSGTGHRTELWGEATPALTLTAAKKPAIRD